MTKDSDETKESYASIDENDINIAAGNVVNEVLLAHKDKWNGDDEIQDMVAEAFVRGVKFEREANPEVV